MERRIHISARDRLEQALARINDPAGEGGRTFLTIYPERARKEADAADRRALDGISLSPLDGVVVSIKDLFDVAGEPTRAGSTVLADAPSATEDAPVLTRLREAGAVIVGKTNMSEFAFTGVGANPHYGTPGNPADRSRVPGGSSSGAAVAVADHMCEISIGTDTGGSTRIPAALCGIVGYKPTKHRISIEGAYPLSPSFDSVGPIARSVEDCAKADTVLAGEEQWSVEPAVLDGLRCGIPQGMPLEELDESVAAAFEAATARLAEAGVSLSDEELLLLDDMARVNSIATIPTVEAWHIHRERLATRGAEYDPLIRERIGFGSAATDEDYVRMLKERGELVGAMDARLGGLDALVLPTTPIVAATIAEVSNEQGFKRANRLLLRNTAIANFFDLCAISLPMPNAGTMPTGLMLVARRGQDRRLFAMAAAIEQLLSS